LLTVSFEARSGQVAADVVNDYVTRMINANVEMRTGSAEDTLSFFEQEVARLGTELERRSNRISDFQLENADALPDNLDYMQSRLSLLQERVANSEREKTSLQDQRRGIETLFQSTGRLATTSTNGPTRDEVRLQDLKAELARALSVYSESNPRVQLLRSQIAQFETLAAAPETISPTDPDGPQTLFNLQLAEIDSRIATIDTDVKQAEAEIALLTDRITRTPQNAITLDALQRDYDNIRLQYDGAVQSLSQASMGERIELTSRGQRITLIESAAVPTKPSSPNRPLIAAAGVGAGVTMAAALFLILELLNRTIRRPTDIRNKLGIIPLASFPYIESGSRRFGRIALRAVLLLAVLIGLPIGLWVVDTYYFPLESIAQRVLDRIGLI
jgi:uncharacterized protein involved in exopolysaccharide biosynthesis